jgi:Rrf2 family protein
MLFVALQPEGNMISIKEITGQLDVPYHFMAKIFRDLAQHGLLVSHRGPRGGFALGMSAQDITLFHVVEAVDGLPLARGCVMGFPECSATNPCGIHSGWEKIRDGIYRMLASKNIAELAGVTKKPGYHTQRERSEGTIKEQGQQGENTYDGNNSIDG